ncbi:uncharacterized protein LOC127079395 [Lathyrus oleraceus]|uniref:uncharacterized protein LOC127079395 n=1 Tax=Pisum sativum TaxID=3888 RepID=UPI0021D23C15|nr:uncharacterized protein LOC127079395 [Pisum sativum]
MCSVKLKQNPSSKKSRVSGFKNNTDDGKVINDVVPLKMIIPEDSSIIKAKATTSKKKKVSNPISLSKNKSSDRIIGKDNKDITKTTQAVESNCIFSMQADIHVGKNVEPIITPQGKVDEDQGRKRKENNQNVVGDDIPISQIIKRIRDDTNKKIKDDEEEIESDEGPMIAMTISSKIREKKKDKVITRETSMNESKKNAKIFKAKNSTTKNTPKKTLKRKLVVFSESEYDDEAYILDIVPSTKKNIGGKKIYANIPDAPLDNMSFYTERNAKKWKLVCQRRITVERELSKDTIEGEILKLLREYSLIKTVYNIRSCYEKLIMEFIVNISPECNKEGTEDFRKVYVRIHRVKFSLEVINESLGRSELTGTDEVP